MTRVALPQKNTIHGVFLFVDSLCKSIKYTVQRMNNNLNVYLLDRSKHDTEPFLTAL